MRLETAFRLSTYLCLIVASLCLGYAEEPYLPQFFWFAVAYAVLLAGAFLLEGRWSLSLGGANILGLFIAVGAGSWLAYHVLHPSAELRGVVVGPVALLPFVGPVLMVLLAAKLLRPKQVNDIWGLHTLGLLQVLLACVLAGQPSFGFFLVAYLIALLWSLSLFYLYRGHSTDGKGRPTSPRAGSTQPLPWRLLGVARALRWAVPVAICGIVLFLLTPQRGVNRWDPGILGGSQDRVMTTGLSATIDLNQTGLLRVDERIAFEVEARRADDTPKTDLNPLQHWRGATVDHYEGGRWTNRIFPILIWHDIERELLPGVLPNLGPEHYSLTFTLDPKNLNRMILADPVWLLPRSDHLPVGVWGERGKLLVGVTPGFQEGEFTPLGSESTNRRYRYIQLALPTGEAELAPAAEWDEVNLAPYCGQPVPGITEEAKRLAERLVGAGQLSSSDLEMVRSPPPRQLLAPEALGAIVSPRGRLAAPPTAPLTVQLDRGPEMIVRAGAREKIARAFCQHLAWSGEYHYSLSIRRENTELDPTLDFLLDVKEGHCTRFATALALLLRSYGIPTRVVVGFKGAEHRGEARYIVRQSQAHTWVQALIHRPGPRRDRLYWLTLDPTPAADTDVLAAASHNVVRELELLFTDLWRGYVLDYDQGQRNIVAASLWERLSQDGLFQHLFVVDGRLSASRIGEIGGVLILCVGGLGVGVRWLRRRRSGVGVRAGLGARVPFYARFLSLLDKHLALVPVEGQTPGEFAETAAVALKARAQLGGAAHIPAALTATFYRVRYGAEELDADEKLDIERRLKELAVALRGVHAS